MSKKIEILLDNGGGLQLQTAKFVHSYESDNMAEQCAEDIREFLQFGDTSDWENNQPEYRREAGLHAEEGVLTRADLEAIIAAGEAIERMRGGATAAELIIELLGNRACEAIHAGFERKKVA